MKKFSQSVKDRIPNYPENLKRAKIRYLKDFLQQKQSINQDNRNFIAPIKKMTKMMVCAILYQ